MVDVTAGCGCDSEESRASRRSVQHLSLRVSAGWEHGALIGRGKAPRQSRARGIAGLGYCWGTAESAARRAVAAKAATDGPAPTRAAAVQMSVPVVDFQGASAGEQDVNLKVAKAGAYVVHRKVVAEQANMRLGTAVVKTRGTCSVPDQPEALAVW